MTSEQIIQFFSNNLMNIVVIISAIAAVVAAFASVKALCPKAKPSIEGPNVWLAIHHANTRWNKGYFLAQNTGGKAYTINNVAIHCASIDLQDYNLVDVNQWPGEGVGKNGAQKLPLSVEANIPKQVFFHTEEIPKKYEGELPNSVTLEVHLSCEPKLIVKTLYREDDTNHYK